MPLSRRTDFVLLTGSTGFVGHRALVELLRRGRRCAVTLRAPVAQSTAALAVLLSDFGIDIRSAIAQERLLPAECDLREGVPSLPGVRVGAVVHAAASTRFEADGTGEPAATNVGGTRRLLDWCGRRGVAHVNLVSSAYACGRWPRGAPVPESPHFFDRREPSFHNDYETSKWEAEQLCHGWARLGAGRAVTVYRPSVVVGEFGTGRATKFDAFYIPVRATEVLSRAFADPQDPRRWSVALRIKGRAADHQNIVPVDYVAAMITHLLGDPCSRGRVYHLTHPHPPTNGQIKQALEEHFCLGGGRFVEPAEMDCAGLNEHERIFADISRPVEHYMIDTPQFDRANAVAAERAAGIACAAYDTAALRRLFSYAESVGWACSRRRRGRTAESTASPTSLLDAYFQGFLPEHVNRSKVARVTGLTVDVRFTIEDEPNGEWVCRFERGRLAQVLCAPAAAGARADFGYRTTRAGFWRAISGRHHPQELFLFGHAHISGDVERALKLAMILNAFAREFPCDERALRPYARCANDDDAAAATASRTEKDLTAERSCA